MNRLYRHPTFRRLAAAVLLLGATLNAVANPTGMTVRRGSATTTSSGSQLTVTTTSQNTSLNWQSFNIAAGETTIFQEPSATSIVWNRINNQNPSQIYGSLQANGVVVLLNSSGFYFGPNSFVSAAGLVVSTANCIPPQNPGGSWEFNGPPPLASIVNYGQIKIGQGGSAYLIADRVENHGTISAPGGTVGLAAGQTVLLSDRPDGRGMSMQVTLPSGSVDNEGRLIADGGTIVMNAKVVNQGGFIQANSVKDVNGVIELVASDQLNLGASSQILAKGDDSAGGSAGGTVSLKSDNDFSDNIGSQIDTRGGSQGGNGGNVEISAPNVLSLNSGIDASAQAGWSGGVFTLDPQNILLGTSGATSGGTGGTINGTGNSGTLSVNVNSAFQNINAGQILLEASGNITLGANTIWDLYASTGNKTSGLLTMEAGGNIIFGDGSLITDANNWSVTLQAGYNFSTKSINYGTGSIYLGGLNGTSPQDFSGSIQTASGSINLAAGQDILVGSGYVITTGGGSISANALKGNIDTGSDAQGYYFSISSVSSISKAYNLQDGLGGISTEAGGNVALMAGGNVTSVLPGNGVYYYDGNQESPNNADYLTAGSGAYGSQPGNVTIVAGGSVAGNYLVANGTGTIYAGVKMVNGVPVDASGNPVTDGKSYVLNSATGSAGTVDNELALNLITGGWTVNAAQDIYLQEVRNPNGVFDNSAGRSNVHYFDYAAGDYVDLNAGNLVQLGASPSVLPRATGLVVPFIYPSILNINAGAGGVELVGDSTDPFNQLILFPSPQGSLTINTTDGGSLVGGLASSGGVPQIFNLIVSDSGSHQLTTSSSDANCTFGINDLAATPIHAATSTDPNNSTPIVLNISGDMSLVLLAVPEAAQINVVGNMYNCRFQGMNLYANDVTSINVGQTAKDNMENSGLLDPKTDSGITVGGDIINRGNFTSVTLDLSQAGVQAPAMDFLSEAYGYYDGNTFHTISAADLTTSLIYNKDTHVLTYQNLTGLSFAKVLSILQNLYISTSIDTEGNPIENPKPVSVLTAATAQVLMAKYNAENAFSGLPANSGPPDGTYGYTIGGGGQFNITARTIDLGTTAGIQSDGVGGPYVIHGNYSLASLFGNGNVFDHGADITITTTGNHSEGETGGDLVGDLDMYSTSIASLQGGNISIYAGGDVNAGSADFTVASISARGIYSSSGGNVSVYAAGNVNVNGSRIATYDGGNVTVESLNGDVNAGTGANGFVVVQQYNVNPDTHVLSADVNTIPGSGILTTTFLDSLNVVGNIFVETPNGNIIASAGGVEQLPVNGVDASAATITLLAGKQAILNTSATGNNVVQLYVFDATTGKWSLESGALQIISVYNKKTKKNENQIDDEPIINDQDIVGFGQTFELLNAGVPVLDKATGKAVYLTPILDASGNPLHDVSGQPLYIKNLVDASGQKLYGENVQVKNGNPGGSIVEITVKAGVLGVKNYLDAGGDPLNVSLPLDLNGNPFPDSLGNPTFVIGRNIDANDSGVIGREVYLDATGNINGLFIGQDVSLNSLQNVIATVLADKVTGNVYGELTGKIIGITEADINNGSGDPTVLSQDLNGSGKSTFSQGTVANSTSQAIASVDATKPVDSSDDEGDLNKKKDKEIALAQKTGRVTIVIPPKNVPGSKNQNPGTQTLEPKT